MPTHPLAPLIDLPGVAGAVDEVREACTGLRWHSALRRGWPVARAEAGLRCAQAGLVVDGLSVPLSRVRALAAGAGHAASDGSGQEGPGRPGTGRVDPAAAAVLGAIRVQSSVVADWGPPGSPTARVPLGQLLARLHSAAVVGTAPVAEPGRLRTTEQPGDLRGLGPAPTGRDLGSRMAALADLDAYQGRGSGAVQVPGLVVAAVLLGELLVLRPFAAANGPVARAVFRRRLTADGVDAVGVVVPEVAWAAAPLVHLSAAAGYATGSAEGVAAWIRHCAAAVLAGAGEGVAVAESVTT
ncbi:cell filamentation protein Fic [Actinotalea sp.]|uniref:cell filamentation protein Fic n=1 Tax=Actinotalea sp. TaxID=1872145 RepID=UPI003569AB87